MANLILIPGIWVEVTETLDSDDLKGSLEKGEILQVLYAPTYRLSALTFVGKRGIYIHRHLGKFLKLA